MVIFVTYDVKKLRKISFIFLLTSSLRRYGTYDVLCDLELPVICKYVPVRTYVHQLKLRNKFCKYIYENVDNMSRLFVARMKKKKIPFSHFRPFFWKEFSDDIRFLSLTLTSLITISNY